MCSFLIRQKMIPATAKTFSDDEKAQLKSQAEAIASGLKEGWRFERACRRARGNGSDTDV